jgi:ketosteroid isomerase-like protein
MDNVEVVRAGYDAFVARDAAFLHEFASPDIEWHPAMGALLKRSVYRGHDEVESLIWDEIPAVLEGFTAEVLDVEALDGERVLAVARFKGTAPSSGVEVEQIFGQVWTLRGGKVVALRSYPSKEQALAAVAETRPA